MRLTPEQIERNVGGRNAYRERRKERERVRRHTDRERERKRPIKRE